MNTVRTHLRAASSTSLVVVSMLLLGCGAEVGRPPSDAPPHDRDAGSTGSSAPAPSASASSVDEPPPAPPPARQQGVVFVHGTGDRGEVSDLTCAGVSDAWHCGSPNAVDYWQQTTIDSERTRTDGSLRPYVVVGCPLSAQTPWPNPTPIKPKDGPPEPGSAACVSAETVRFIDGPDGLAGTADDVDDIAIVTHSGGANVVRYILQQHGARADFARIHHAARGLVALSAPARGTYLADRVFGFGLLGIGNDLFGAGYDDDGVDFIQTTKMALFNQDPAKLVDLSKDVAGVPVFVGSGSYPDADGDPEKIACGGKSETQALNLLHGLYMDETDEETVRDGCSDGFVSCESALGLANGDLSRVIFGRLAETTIGTTRFRAHNQTRRDCNGVDVDVRTTVNAIFDGGKSGASLLGTSSRRERFVPMARSVTTRLRSVALEAPMFARAGELARVRVEVLAAPLEGFLESPAGTTRIPVSFERDPMGVVFANARIPADARTGAWTMHVAERDDLERRLDARVPFWVSGAHGAIVQARATAEDGGVLVRLVATTDRGGRIGARATLVSETADDVWVVTSSQASADVEPRGGAVRLDVFLASPPSANFEGRFVVRDVVLIAHDEASTLDARERIDLSH